MKATWSNDSDSSSNDEEEHVTNMCFMTIESDNEEWRVVFGWCLLKAHDRR
jgi:hypothetical protein